MTESMEKRFKRQNEEERYRWHTMRNMELHLRLLKKSVRDLISISKKVAAEELRLRKRSGVNE